MFKIIRQIKMSRSLEVSLLAYCKRSRLKLFDVHQEAIERFIELRNRFDNFDSYFASPTTGRYRSLWITESTSRAVKTVSETDGVSQNRVIYTSLLLYERHVIGGESLRENGICHQK